MSQIVSESFDSFQSSGSDAHINQILKAKENQDNKESLIADKKVEKKTHH